MKKYNIELRLIIDIKNEEGISQKSLAKKYGVASIEKTCLALF